MWSFARLTSQQIGIVLKALAIVVALSGGVTFVGLASAAGGELKTFGTRGNVTPTTPMYGGFTLVYLSDVYIAVRGPSLGTLGYTNNPLNLPNVRVYDVSGNDVLRNVSGGVTVSGCPSSSTVANYYATIRGSALNVNDTCVWATLAAGVYTFTINPNTSSASGELLFEVTVNPESSSSSSLNGTYKLQRASVIYPSTGSILDSEQPILVVSGYMVINGTLMTQSMSLTYSGQTTSITMNGTFTDYGYYLRAVTTTGVTTTGSIIKRGSEFITLLANSSFSEVDYWIRTSTATALQGSLKSMGVVAEPSNQVSSNQIPIGGGFAALLGVQ